MVFKMIDIDGVLYRVLFDGLTLLSQSLAGLEIHEDGGRLMNKFASQLQVQVNGVSFCHGPMGFLAHGGGNTTWFQYVSGERKPEAKAFKQR